ncbi:MAG: acyl-CoA thioesterase [Deltaproteobacteria bacterium]|nr:acyl-CoA thioesterase [Deltaproteobacteria bacterium]MBW2033669.1 acyl-CoA thioesterase [Deltaproteobacteria bacterium]MBW2115789.1 acyl-CoA thioesterase [Deltaproteobacteria bacterium]MBW2168578.1 acyl-CoA thioesterase [Deltaproteobacteria bacterium]
MKQNIVERKVMWGDLDSLGIVFYPRYYEWIDACGHLFFEAINLNIGDLWRERRILFGLVETSCRYLKPARYHQEIRIVTNINALDNKTIVIKHSMRALENDELMVEGLEKRICLDVSDPEAFRAIDFPDDIYTVLKGAKD